MEFPRKSSVEDIGGRLFGTVDEGNLAPLGWIDSISLVNVVFCTWRMGSHDLDTWFITMVIVSP